MGPNALNIMLCIILYKHTHIILTICVEPSHSFSSSLCIFTLNMYFMLIFLLTTISGINDETIKIVSGEKVPEIQHHLVNESKEPRESSSSRKKRSWGTPGMHIKIFRKFKISF